MDFKIIAYHISMWGMFIGFVLGFLGLIITDMDISLVLEIVDLNDPVEVRQFVSTYNFTWLAPIGAAIFFVCTLVVTWAESASFPTPHCDCDNATSVNWKRDGF